MQKTEDPILAGLNPEQLAAVRHGSGPVMIVAGAGTGKTTVLARRIAWLISQKKARPEQVLALTFSDKAAQEMEERVDVLVPYGFAPVSLSTFHAFGSRMLKEQSHRLGLNPDAELLSGAQLQLFLKKHLFRLPLKRFRPLANPAKHIEDLLKLFSRAKDEAVSPERYVAAAQALGSLAKSEAELEEAADQAELAAAYQAYDELLHGEGFLDHGDQLLLPLRILREHPLVLENTRAAYPWILVDEFQDTNTVQFELLKLLAPRGVQDNLTVVGDDDQAIYRFRGASLSNILEFKQAYPAAKTVVITRNYRSRQDVLDCAYRLIQFNNPERLEAREKLDKRLSSSRDGDGAQAVFYQAFDQRSSELAALSQQIGLEVGAGRRRYRDFAVLLRSNASAEEVIQELNYRGIPSRFSGARGLYKQREVHLCLAFLRALARPQDNLALFDHLAGDVCRVPVSDLKELLGRARSLNKSLYHCLTRTDLTRAGEELELDAEARDRAEKAILDLARYEEVARARGLAAALYQFLDESGVIARLLAGAAGPDGGAERQVANLARFFDKIKAYDRVEKPGSYLAVIDYLEALIKEGDDPPAAEAELDADAVAISTVHRSKGLEWPVVFVASLEDQHFPMSRKAEGFSLPGALFPEPEDAVLAMRREERRLFYVAMTRARDELRLSFAYDQGGKKMWKRSPFLQEALSLGKDEGAPQRLAQSEKLARHAAPQAHPLLEPLCVAREGEALRLSYYPIDDYLTCPLKYKFAHALKLKPPASASITYGSVMHQAVQDFNRAKMEGREFSLEQLKQALKSKWKSEGYVSLEHEEERLENGLRRLEAFFAGESAARRVAVEVETRFELRLGPLEFLAGQMDRIDKDENGELTICDYKTSNVHEPKKAKAELKKSLQLAIYALAYEARSGVLPDWLELHFLESGIQERLKPDKAYLEEKRAEIMTAFSGIRRNDFSPAPDFIKCKFCAYAQICPSSGVA
jgi:DNA helicase-2/ATP-dependent DNA helicase PcrA